MATLKDWEKLAEHYRRIIEAEGGEFISWEVVDGVFQYIVRAPVPIHSIKCDFIIKDS